MPPPRANPLDEPIAFGPFVLDPAAAVLRRDAGVVRLRPKAWETLRYLVERPGRLVSNDELLDAVWPDAAVTPQTLTNVIRELRLALDDRARAPRYLETVYGRGYVFVAAPRPVAEEEPVRALRYLERAAAHAERHFAYRETTACLRAALSYLEQPGGTPSEHREHAGELAVRLGSALTLAASYSAPEVGEAFTRARAFFASVESMPGTFVAELGLARWAMTRADYAGARVHTDRLLAIGRSSLPQHLAEACCWAGFAASVVGDLPAARALLEDGSVAAARYPHPPPHDSARLIASQLGLVLTAMGQMEAGRARTAEALAVARAGGRPGEIAHGSLVAAECAVFAREREAGLAVAREALALSTDNGLQSFVPLARLYVAWLDDAGPPAERLAVMRGALADRERLGDRWHTSMLLALVAEVELEARDPRAAITTLAHAAAHVETTGERHYEAEVHRLRGACALALDDRVAAAAWTQRALGVARAQGARLLERRAAAQHTG